MRATRPALTSDTPPLGVVQDLLGDTDQCALSQVRRERAAAATRAADFQENRRRLAAEREERTAVSRGIAAARHHQKVAWNAKEKKSAREGAWRRCSAAVARWNTDDDERIALPRQREARSAAGGGAE